MIYYVLFKSLSSQRPNQEAANSSGLLKCEPSQRLWKEILLSTVTKQVIRQVTAGHGQCFTPPHTEKEHKETASGEVGMSAHQTRHDDCFVSSYSVLYPSCGLLLWQLLRKHYCERPGVIMVKNKPLT